MDSHFNQVERSIPRPYVPQRLPPPIAVACAPNWPSNPDVSRVPAKRGVGATLRGLFGICEENCSKFDQFGQFEANFPQPPKHQHVGDALKNSYGEASALAAVK